MSEKFTLEACPNNITELRNALGITVAELARRMGTSKSRINNVRSGKPWARIKAECAEQFAAALEVEPERVFPDYAQAKRDYKKKMEREREFIFHSREERDKAIESTWRLAVYVAEQNAWRVTRCRNSVMDMEDCVGEALLSLVEVAEQVMCRGIPKGVNFSKYAGGATEMRFKTMYRDLSRQRRAAYLGVSLDAQTGYGDGLTYQDYIESLIPGANTTEETVMLREECREAVRLLTPERRQEPEIAALLRQIAI